MIKVYYVTLLIIIGLVICSCASSTESPKTLAPAQQSQKPNYILTGTLIEPNSAWAFILIPVRNNEEKIYKIGDKLDEWEIIGISSNEVKLRNGKNEIIYLKIHSNITYNKVNESSQEVRVYDTPISPVRFKELLAKYCDIPIEDMPADDKIGEYARNLFKIFEGQSPVSATIVVENILFTTSVNENNSPISPTISFKAGDHKIYACFTNQGSLTGLSRLVHRWTNKSTGEIITLEIRPIDSNAPFNFIWIRKTDGWQVGEYTVELFKTQTLEKVAEGKFTIVAEENKKEDVKDKSDKSIEPDKSNEPNHK